MPPLPGKAFVKQLPFIASDDGIFEPEFVEERRLGLEVNVLETEGFLLRHSLSRNLSTRSLVTPWCRPRDVSTCSSLSPVWTSKTMSRAKSFNVYHNPSWCSLICFDLFYFIHSSLQNKKMFLFRSFDSIYSSVCCEPQEKGAEQGAGQGWSAAHRSSTSQLVTEPGRKITQK